MNRRHERLVYILARPVETAIPIPEEEYSMAGIESDWQKRTDFHMQEMSERLATLMGEYRTNHQWIRDTLTGQTGRLHELERKVTLHNGVAEKVVELGQRVSTVERALGDYVTAEQFAAESASADTTRHRTAVTRLQVAGLVIAVILGLSGWVAALASLL
jgi:type I site-specific restriction endonuclease